MSEITKIYVHMEKEKARNLCLFLQERTMIPLTVEDYFFEEKKTPEITIPGEVYSLKFKFHKNGKVKIRYGKIKMRSKFSDSDSRESSYWTSTLEKTIRTTIVKDKNSDDLVKLREVHSQNSRIISGREDFLRRYPQLRLPEYYNIQNSIWLSEDCAIDLLKSFVTGG